MSFAVPHDSMFAFNKENFSDIQLKFQAKDPDESQAFYASRLLLSQHSEFFRTLLEDCTMDPSDGSKLTVLEVPVTHQTMASVELALRLIYGDPAFKASLVDQDVVALLTLCEQYCLNHLLMPHVPADGQQLMKIFQSLPAKILMTHRTAFLGLLTTWLTASVTAVEYDFVKELVNSITARESAEKTLDLIEVDAPWYVALADILARGGQFINFEAFCEGPNLGTLSSAVLACLLRSDKLQNIRSEHTTWRCVERWFVAKLPEEKSGGGGDGGGGSGGGDGGALAVVVKKRKRVPLEEGGGMEKEAAGLESAGDVLPIQETSAKRKEDLLYNKNRGNLERLCSVLRFQQMTSAFLCDVVSEAPLSKNFPGVVLPRVVSALSFHRDFGCAETRLVVQEDNPLSRPRSRYAPSTRSIASCIHGLKSVKVGGFRCSRAVYVCGYPCSLLIRHRHRQKGEDGSDSVPSPSFVVFVPQFNILAKKNTLRKKPRTLKVAISKLSIGLAGNTDFEVAVFTDNRVHNLDTRYTGTTDLKNGFQGMAWDDFLEKYLDEKGVLHFKMSVQIK